MKDKVLHIAAHLGGGAGKAISGLAIGLNEYVHNKVILLEEPEQDRYVRACRENSIDVIISRDEEVLKREISLADYVIFSWWGHPLSYEIYKVLSKVEARIFLWSHVNGLYYPYISPRFLELFDGVMFTSGCTYENSKWSGEERDIWRKKTEIIYGIGGFVPAAIQTKPSYNIGDKYMLCYSGTVNYSKMNKEFPRLCEKLKKDIPSVDINIYGKYDEETYESFTALDDADDYVHMWGFVDDIECRLCEMDVYCYPLTDINFATTENALLEAMAAGLPVVVLDNPAERNIVIHEKTGYVAKNIDEMESYLLKLYSDNRTAKELGQNARNYVIATYDYHINAKKCVEYIRKYSYDKKLHNFISLLGKSPGDNLLFFADCDKDGMKQKLRDKSSDNIFLNDSKGSPYHYKKYYKEDNILKELCGERDI